MASINTIAAESSLPAKKRKASNASSQTSGSGGQAQIMTRTAAARRTGSEDRSSATSARSLPSKKRKRSHESAEAANREAQQESASTVPTREINSAALPSENKRKGSLDSATVSFAKRKSSADSSGGHPSCKASLDSLGVTFEDDVGYLDLIRKFSDTTGVSGHADELMQSPGLKSSESVVPSSLPASTLALEHLDVLGQGANPGGSVAAIAPVPVASAAAARQGSDADNSNSAPSLGSSGQRLLIDAIMQSGMHMQAARDRFESWGGMSDLSLPHNAEEDRLNTAGAGRDRLNSVASLSEVSINLPILLDCQLNDGIVVNASDIQLYVAAAVASVGDQLAQLASQVESVANARSDGVHESESSSVASPLIGAVSDAGGNPARAARGRPSRRPRSWSVSSGKISVDYDAVRAAVDAAQAATGALDLAAVPVPQTSGSAANSISTAAYNGSTNKSDATGVAVNKGAPKGKPARAFRRKLPLSRQVASPSSPDPPGASLGDEEKEQIRKRARSVARRSAPPLKKRANRTAEVSTPVVSNRRHAPTPVDVPSASLRDPDSAKNSSAACQKWNQMYDLLVKFAEERRDEGFWDGNVPTNHKTKDGKALGRWVNNQRSAKNNGTLKGDREERLVSAGLKWTVLGANNWNEMRDELCVYIREQSANGKKWDGNVPTNYQTKTGPNSQFQSEDRNLGRWVNRQRSMYQSGKLRKDRQDELEKLGLKWSMLATTSWDTMYDTLCEYVENQKKCGEWDGNVPANFKTSDDPPRNLGRWINRQRSAYGKNKLKKEYKDKLNSLGLKWSVHERGRSDNGDDDSVKSNAQEDEDVLTEEV